MREKFKDHAIQSLHFSGKVTEVQHSGKAKTSILD